MTKSTSAPRSIAATVAELPGAAKERFGERVATRRKVDGEWREHTYREIGTMIDEIALGLVDLGIERRSRLHPRRYKARVDARELCAWCRRRSR
jgi:long-chain acyl-CoA synthetase